MAVTSQTGGTFDIRPTLAGRARAVGLVFLYLAVFALILAALVLALATTGLAPAVRAEHLAPTQMTWREWADAVAALLAVVVLAAIVREPVSRFGFAKTGAGRDLLLGLVASFVLMGAFFAALAAVGAYEFRGVALAPGQIGGLAALYALFDIGVAVFEETLFRSFLLVQLSRAFGFWPAAIVTALLFGLAHAGNPAEAPLGLAVAGLGGLVFAYAFRRSGAIWFAIGFHAALAYMEDFVIGVPDSGGHAPQGALLQPLVRGPAWLTGGGVGPEGGVPALLLILVLALVARFLLPRRLSPPFRMSPVAS